MSKPHRGATVTLVAGHTVNDIYQGAVPALVPFLVAERGYGYVAAAGITLAATLLSSVAQPLFGLLTDRRPAPLLVPLGMLLAGAGIACAGLPAEYPLVWLAVAVSGLGVAAYHPEAARLARAASGGSHVAMSWFSLGGNVGFATGPLLVAPVLATTGLPGTPFLVIPALVGGVGTVVVLRRWSASAPASTPDRTTGASDDWRAFGWLSVAVVCRSIIAFGLSTFLALHVQDVTGGSTVAGAAALVVMFGAGACGTLIGGSAAGRFGRVRTVRYAYAALFPALVALLLASGPVVYVAVAAVGLIGNIPFSLHVTLGQDYLPRRVGTASGVTLGLSVSIGGLAAPGIGALAQATSLHAALFVLLACPVAGYLAARALPEPAVGPMR